MIGKEKKEPTLEERIRSGEIKLVGSNKCPVCGKQFTAMPPLRPNVRDREFYGGRVKFFKEVDCDCTAKYELFVEKKFNPVKVEEEFHVINMAILKKGKPLSELELEKLAAKRAEEKANDEAKLQEAQAKNDERSTVNRRIELKKQKILATIVDKDTKIATLMAHTTHELQAMCKKRKLKYSTKDSKFDLAETLLAFDPNVVVANPDGLEQHT